MVTRILLDPRRDLPTGLTGSSTITVEATPTGVREDGSVVVLPTKLSFTVNTAADVVQLAPPAASWAWRIVSRDAVSNVILQQRTVRFADVPSVPYADLTDVDPSSLKQTPSTSRQWDATFFQLLDLIAALQPVGLSPAVEAEILARVNSAVAPILAGSDAALDSFLEVATKFGVDEGTVTALQALVASKATTAQITTAIATQATLDAASYLTFDGINLVKNGSVVNPGVSTSVAARSASISVLHYRRGAFAYPNRLAGLANLYVGPVRPTTWIKNDLWMKVA